MFKGLRSKLEDEAKRLQATVSQYGENLASQVRSNASEAGSDISIRGRKLVGSALDAVQPPDSADPKKNAAQNNDETIISFHDEESSQLADVSASSSATASRQRRLSNASVESNESSFNFSSQVKTSPTLVLDPISSDVESNAGSVADLSSLDNVPNDKITSIFQRLQGRAVDYKQKYRELVKAYREIERENEKCQMVLASTQDKALSRIAKLKEERRNLHEKCKELEQNEEKLATANGKVHKMQELLSKCKDEITANRERIASLTEENKLLNEHENAEHSNEKLSAEWKGRFDRQEDEWTKRMGACEERTAIAIATHKAEMHSTLQQKDQEIEGWIEKCHSLEKRDGDSNALWLEKVGTLQKDIEALEHEKADMIQKLSQAKQEGVKLVKESEEKRHSETLSEELRKKDEEWGRRVKELEEQMQLAMEESDLQRKTSVAEHERDLSKMRGRIGELETEHSQILQQFYGQKEELERIKKEKEMDKSEESALKADEEEEIEERKKEEEREKCAMKLEMETIKRERDELAAQVEKLREQIIAFEEEKGELKLELKSVKRELKGLKQVESQLEEKRTEIERTNGELRTTESARDEALEKLKTMEERTNEEKQRQRRETEQLKKEAEKAKLKAIADLQSEIRQLYHDINEKDCELAATHANISRLENELKALRTEQDNGKQDSHQRFNSFGEGIDLDELLELRQQLDEREAEVQCLKTMLQDQQNGANGSTVKPRAPTHVGKNEFRAQLSNASDHLNFAEPTEAEYLRNVLYRYMTERETLGRESVTLAKVIATVCKFPPEQLSLVLRREEARCQAWLPGSVVHALTHPTLSQRNAPQLSPSTMTTSSLNLNSQQQQHLMSGNVSRQAPF